MQKSNFSEIIKKDELGQYHIRMGQKVYVIDAMRTLGRCDWYYRIITINHFSNGHIYPMSPYECFTYGWIIRCAQKELLRLLDRRAHSNAVATNNSRRAHAAATASRRAIERDEIKSVWGG